MGRGKGGAILVCVRQDRNDSDTNLMKKTKQAMVGQLILSGMLTVFGNRIQGYMN